MAENGDKGTMISIDEAARKKFEADWQQSNSLSIKEYLPPEGNETYIGTLEELVCIDLEFRWRRQSTGGTSQGATVTTDEAIVATRVEDYLREFPELDDPDIVQRLVEQEIYVRVNSGFVVEPSEYRSRFPSLTLDDSMFSSDAADGGAKSSTVSVQSISFPKQFGDYVLTGELGRGGMGAVYRARQPAAGREVAIKIADVSAMSAGMRNVVCSRFEKETHAAASLLHDHVVPIYDVGMIDGQPYYAMRLVEGGDLGAMSKEEPLESARAARYMHGIAEGIAKAHDRGMLHRDIKPQNILVDQTTDRAMITDFGLARFMEEDSGMTQTGQVLGTPSYMPPEQIRDSSNIDSRADVYSLGGTLYQLVTGRPPFKAADMQETLRQVTAEEPVSPRRLNPGVDRDLDTICLKCLEKEPEGRYQSAVEFAQDLDRYLAGQPILARPAGPAKRLFKWCRRNQRLAAALALAVVGLLSTAIVAFVGWRVTQNKNAHLAKNHQVTTESWDELYLQVSDEPLLSSPGLEHVRQRFMQRALDYYQQLIVLNEDVPSLKADQAFALAAVGTMGLQVDKPLDEVELALKNSLKMIDALSDEERAQARILKAHSNALNGLAQVSNHRGNLDEALEYFRKTETIRQQWVDGFPNDREAKRKLANAIMNQGIVLRVLGKLPEAEAKALDAQKIRYAMIDQQSDEGPVSMRLKRDMAKAEFNLAMLELSHGNRAEMVLRLKSARSLFGEIAEAERVDVRLWREYANVRLTEADLTTDHNASAAAKLTATELINEALSDLFSLFQISHGQPTFRLTLLQLYQYGIDALVSQDNLVQAEDQFRRAQEMLRSFEKDVSQLDGKASNAAYRVVQLHHLKHDALLTVGFEKPKAALEVLDSTINEFESQRDLVESDGLLLGELQRLHSIREDLRLQLNKLEAAKNE